MQSLQKNVEIPSYNREGLIPSMAHIGLGNFHRGHQAFFTDHLLNKNIRDTSILGVGIMPNDINMKNALTSQDFLYTLITKSKKNNSARIIGSIVDFIYAKDNIKYTLERLSNPNIKIISMTVTEKGLFI